jgi:hypothetical protein
MLMKTSGPYRNARTDGATHDRFRRLAAISNRNLMGYLKLVAFNFEKNVIFSNLSDDERARYVDGTLTAAESEDVFKRLEVIVRHIRSVTPPRSTDSLHRHIGVDLETWHRLHRMAAILDCKKAAVLRWMAVEHENRQLARMTAAESERYCAGTLSFQEAQGIYERSQKPAEQLTPTEPDIVPLCDAGGGP